MKESYRRKSSLEDRIYGLRSIYRKLPYPFRSLAGGLYRHIPIRWRFGAAYENAVDEISSFEHLSQSEIEEYQIARFRSLFQHCIENVPYYRSIFGKLQGGIPEFNKLCDLRSLPLLTKEIVKTQSKNFLAENIPHSRYLHMNTGGSTGVPLELFYEKGISRSREWAFIHDVWKRAGWKEGDKTVMLRGWSVPSRDYWQCEPIRNRLIMSAYHLNSDTIPTYLKTMRNFKPIFIEAYPSNVALIAKYMIRNDIPPIDTIKGILAGSENLFPQQRKIIEKAFNCRVLSWYGHGEICALGGECEYSTDYHMFPSYGITELIDGSGNPVTKPGLLGEIVVTGFNNDVMPLIRYQTGDMGVLAEGNCKCGRQWLRLSRIEGRKQELVVASDGSVITLTALVFGQHYEAFSNIVRLQLAQKNPGEITIRIIPSDAYLPERDEKEMLARIEGAADSGFKVRFEYPDSISRTPRGKHIFLEQELCIEDFLS